MKSTLVLIAIALFIEVLAFVACSQKGVPQMIDAGGYRVRVLVEGQGSPAVVFIGGGFGAWLETWHEVRIIAVLS
jgi:hypothetical protein